jgi:hypothetical protein
MNMSKDASVISIEAGEALEANRLVKLSSGTAVYCDAGNTPVGVNLDYVASGAMASIKLLANGVGTFAVESAGAVSANATVYTAADGKFDDTVTDTCLGTLMEAATSGDVCEIVSNGLHVITNADHITDPAASASDPTLDASDITDNSGGTDPGDHTIAAISSLDIDSSGGNTYADATVEAAVDAVTTEIANAIALIAASYNSLKDDTEALETSLEDAIDDIQANNAAIDLILAALEGAGILKSS